MASNIVKHATGPGTNDWAHKAEFIIRSPGLHGGTTIAWDIVQALELYKLHKQCGSWECKDGQQYRETYYRPWFCTMIGLMKLHLQCGPWERREYRETYYGPWDCIVMGSWSNLDITGPGTVWRDSNIVKRTICPGTVWWLGPSRYL